MSERRGTKALELWCRRITDGYPGVSVQNMTTSWKDGLAFCAMIHHFRPELIDFSSLNKDNIYGNNELAFRTAEKHLGIPALLDAEDMASCTVPDRLSILTYLSQFYQVFGGASPNRRSLNKTSENSNDQIGTVPESPQPKVNSRLEMRKELCANCALPVFLAEKLVVSRSIFHRSCFRCFRCCQQLIPGNYYETEDSQFCCETCPLEDNPGLMLSDTLSFNDEQNNKESYLENEKDSEIEDQFDEIINIISDKMDKLVSKQDEPNKRAPIQNTSQKHNFLIGSAFDTAKCKQVGDDDKLENFTDKMEAVLRKSSSLENLCEHTIKNSEMIPEMTRRFSLIQHRLKCSEIEPELNPKPTQEIKKLKNTKKKISDHKNDYPESLNPFLLSDEDEILISTTKIEKRSINPFDNTNNEAEPDEKMIPPEPVERMMSREATKDIQMKRLLEAPQINLNPFWGDDDEPKINSDHCLESENKLPPVPKPRTLRPSHMEDDTLTCINTNVNIYSSNTSIASSCSTTPGTIHRKKKPAPMPPAPHQLYGVSTSSLNTSTNSNESASPRITFKTRKNKLAPAPPPPITGALSTEKIIWERTFSPSFDELKMNSRYPDNDMIDQHSQLWNEKKLNKDEVNKNTQNFSYTRDLPQSYLPDKNVDGKWKRKKGPAPIRPSPLRRKIKVMSLKDVKLELDQIEMQQQGLEKQGVRLEQIIRDKCETDVISEDISVRADIEDLVLELFSLVNEKNELFRRQAELMQLRRQQRLEEEHADIEYQVRCLMMQPEATKTDFDKQQEEILIQRLVDIVERRNEIIDCLEMDRKREIEEDTSIHKEMDLYATKRIVEKINVCNKFHPPSQLKKEKTKEKKFKKNNKKNMDKDDEHPNLRKWF